jgi:hypothetical protein
MNERKSWGVLFAILIACVSLSEANAGMPAPLPTDWTVDNTPEWSQSSGTVGRGGSGDARLQAISFFVASLLLCAWGVRWLWSTLSRDVPWLPELTYRRSLSLVVLWGLLFVVVLTMISGARELMTPGAWRKQGWTYKLAETEPNTPKNFDLRVERRKSLERLRQHLWQHAATHQGRFPDLADSNPDADLWNIPGAPGLKFILVPNRHADEAGRLLVCEPELENEERQVLLTNGMLGTMRTAEIHAAMASDSPDSPVDEHD